MMLLIHADLSQRERELLGRRAVTETYSIEYIQSCNADWVDPWFRWMMLPKARLSKKLVSLSKAIYQIWASCEILFWQRVAPNSVAILAVKHWILLCSKSAKYSYLNWLGKKKSSHIPSFRSLAIPSGSILHAYNADIQQTTSKCVCTKDYLSNVLIFLIVSI